MTALLIVEDEESVRHLISVVLERQGFAIRTADNGLAALERLAEARPDGVLLDVMLPGLDGLGVLAAIRRDDATLPVLLMTTLADDDQRRRYLDLGATAVLRKPFHPAGLLATVRAHLFPETP